MLAGQHVVELSPGDAREVGDRIQCHAPALRVRAKIRSEDLLDGMSHPCTLGLAVAAGLQYIAVVRDCEDGLGGT